jgi:hypothetical protein
MPKVTTQTTVCGVDRPFEAMATPPVTASARFLGLTEDSKAPRPSATSGDVSSRVAIHFGGSCGCPGRGRLRQVRIARSRKWVPKAQLDPVGEVGRRGGVDPARPGKEQQDHNGVVAGRDGDCRLRGGDDVADLSGHVDRGGGLDVQHHHPGLRSHRGPRAAVMSGGATCVDADAPAIREIPDVLAGCYYTPPTPRTSYEAPSRATEPPRWARLPSRHPRGRPAGMLVPNGA